MQSMIESNPQLQALMQSNPELAHVLRDPNTIRQAMEVIRNPALMQEQTRNTDRAMANIEGMPGGYNALASMYQVTSFRQSASVSHPPKYELTFLSHLAFEI